MKRYIEKYLINISKKSLEVSICGQDIINNMINKTAYYKKNTEDKLIVIQAFL